MGIGPQNLGAGGGKEGYTPCGHPASPLNKIVGGEEVDTSKPGMSNAGNYPGVHAFAGPHGTYPINTEKRGKSAIKLAHNASDPSKIKAKVYKKYPNLKPEIGVQAPDNSQTA